MAKDSSIQTEFRILRDIDSTVQKTLNQWKNTYHVRIISAMAVGELTHMVVTRKLRENGSKITGTTGVEGV